MGKWRWLQLRTGSLTHVIDCVYGRPLMCGNDARIRAALEHGSKEIPVFFPIWAPVCRRLC